MVVKKDEIGGGTKSEETTSETEPEITLEGTEDTVVDDEAKQLLKLINDNRADLGRQLKSTLDANTALQRNYDTQAKRVAELERSEKERRQRERERELNTAEGTPDLLDSIRLKHKAEDEWDKVNRERSELEAEKSRHQIAVEKALRAEATELANDLAKTSSLTATLLLQIATDTSDGKTTYSLERMKSIALSSPKGKSEEEGEESQEEGAETEAVKGQRSRAASAGSRTATRGYRTFADYEKAFTSNEISYEQYQEAARRFNVNI